MANPQAAMLVIGDEILSGRTEDANVPHLARALTAMGIDLREVRIVSDRAEAIEGAVRSLADAYDHVFTSGGIGPTHDDITADCVARAMGAAIDIRQDARAVLEAYYAERDVELNAARLRMARIPAGATLIENPVSAAPGFSLGNVHVMAGVPRIFRGMVATLLPRIEGGRPLAQRQFTVTGGEGDVAAALGEAQSGRPQVSIGSYPAEGEIAIVIRGADEGAVADAERALKARLKA